MDEKFQTKLLLLVVGTLFGIISAWAGAAFKNYLDRKTERDKARAAFWGECLYPLFVSASELKNQLIQIAPKVFGEKDISEQDLKDDYHLRKWFRWCKDHILGAKDGLPDEQRREDVARHSGGIGCEACSTLYITGYYLFFATRIRLSIPQGQVDQELIHRIDNVRVRFSALEFYRVTQDSTGISMKGSAGGVMNYREFTVALTDKSQRAWFLTLADTYFKLHRQNPDHVQAIIQALDELIHFLARDLHLQSNQPTRQVL